MGKTPLPLGKEVIVRVPKWTLWKNDQGVFYWMPNPGQKVAQHEVPTQRFL